MPRDPADSREIPSGTSHDATGCRGIPWDPIQDLAGSHRGPVGIQEQITAVTSVGIYEIRWDALGLGSGLGLGFSRELAGISEKSWELVGGEGVDINSRDHTREPTGTNGNSREPSETHSLTYDRNRRTSKTALPVEITWDNALRGIPYEVF